MDDLDQMPATDEGRLYHLSGRYELPGLLLGVASGAATAWGAGLGYGIAAGFFGVAWVSAIAVLIVTVILALLEGRLMKAYRVRSLGAARTASVAAAVAFLVGDWTGWTWVMLDQHPGRGVPLGSLLFDPRALWDALGAASALPGKDAPRPAWLGVAGVAEALVALWILPTIVAADLDDDIYCEDCGLWCEREKAVLRLKSPAAIDVKDRLLARDMAALAGLDPAPEPLGEALEIDLHQCSGCRELAAASLRALTLKPAKKAGEKPLLARAMVLEKMLLTAAEADALRAVAILIATRAPAATETAEVEVVREDEKDEPEVQGDGAQ